MHPQISAELAAIRIAQLRREADEARLARLAQPDRPGFLASLKGWVSARTATAPSVAAAAPALER